MGFSFSQETANVLNEVRPQPTLEELRAAVAPALASAESHYAQIRSEEDSLRAQLDAKLDAVTAAQSQVARYRSAVGEIEGQTISAPVLG